MMVGSSSTYYNLLSNNIGSILGTSSTSPASSLADLLGGIGGAAAGISEKPNAEDSKTATEIGSLKSGAEDLTASINALRDGGFKDAEDAVGKLESFADSYNKMLETARGIGEDGGNSKLASQMSNVANTYSGALEKLGISFGEDGMMSVDTEKAAESAESGAMKSFFSDGKGLSYGFSNQIGRIASNVSRNPAGYANKTPATESVGYNSSGTALSNLFGNSGFSGSLISLLL